MRARLEQVADGLAVHLPRAVADDAGLLGESEVDVALVDGKVVLTPLAGERLTLEGLLAGVTEANRHGEIPAGSAVGQEAWSSPTR